MAFPPLNEPKGHVKRESYHKRAQLHHPNTTVSPRFYFPPFQLISFQNICDMLMERALQNVVFLCSAQICVDLVGKVFYMGNGPYSFSWNVVFLTFCCCLRPVGSEGLVLDTAPLSQIGTEKKKLNERFVQSCFIQILIKTGPYQSLVWCFTLCPVLLPLGVSQSRVHHKCTIVLGWQECKYIGNGKMETILKRWSIFLQDPSYFLFIC